MILRKLKHLLWLYFDLKEHKKQGRIKDFKLHWNSYDIYVCPTVAAEMIQISYTFEKNI